MIFWTIVKTATKALAANKLRTALTLLGIVIGVASVIAMLALGEGARQQITSQMRNFGANLLSIRPDWRRQGGVRMGDYAFLKVEHAEMILREVPQVDMVSPDLDADFQVKYLNNNDRVQINGEAPTYFAMRNFPIAQGRIFTDKEVAEQAKVAVIGPALSETLFEGEEPLGKEVKVQGVNVTVIGVTAPKDENSDDNMWVPYTTLMQRTGQQHIDQIYARVREGADALEAQGKISEVLRRAFRIQEGQPDNFRISNRQEVIDSLEQVASVFQYLLGGVAAISLLVGGINIMNIMLVTVTERTREIGVRKAMGARRFDLLGQFLLEAATVSAIGGAVGVGLGMAMIHGFNYAVINYWQMDPTNAVQAIVQPWTILLAFGTSAAIGLFFGWYPARRAAAMDPIDALRHE